MQLTRFLNYLQYEKNYSSHTFDSYKKDIQNFISFLESQDFTIYNASHHQIRAYLASLMNSGLQARSVNKTISTLRTFYKFLLREKQIASDPTLLIKNLKIPRQLPTTIDESSLINLLENRETFTPDFFGQRDRLVMELLFGTGIRRAELLAIKEDDIDFYAHSIRILGKGNKERIVPIYSSLAELIQTYIQFKRQQFGEKDTQLIVTDKGKNAYANLIYTIVTHYLGRISTQQKISPHVLRHSFATSLLNRGASINDIKELLGHASLAATQIYTHSSVEKLKSIYKQAHPKA